MIGTSLSRSFIDQVEPGGKPVVHYDAHLKGFGLRVMPSGYKSWIVEYRPYGGGRRVGSRRMVLGSAATLTAEEARKEAKRILALVRLGGDPAKRRESDREAPTVREFSRKFMDDHVREKRKRRTVVMYQDHFDRLINPLIGSAKIHLVTKSDVSSMHRKIAKSGQGGRRREGSANRVLTTLSSMFGFASREDVLPDNFVNPVTRVERYPENYTAHYLTLEELTKVGAALKMGETIGILWRIGETARGSKHLAKPENRRTIIDPHAAAAVRLLLLTGARKGEILNLRWDEVDFERKLLLLPDSKTGEKTIPLNSFALAVLANIPRIGPYVIPGRRDPDKPRGNIQKTWLSILRQAGIPHARIHDLRHTHASIGVAQSVGLAIIGKILGHTSTAMTARYAHLETNPVRRGSEKIGRSISKAMGL
ncbi:tyrosine-type recombinase/integrase [Mesorhizobium sp. B261B1A]|uniref:tyrosine-type recombinase/integrase n=1 Tax=Mesorhizobium sp. B261B1A TaxID=2876671 RepID=UPI001CD12841|nr:site-specific integrase [Mesorhizobium sp. B261B1A]MCA0058027.1 site-specific integrase [Mesorhizobium sp. B261B1A]